jgi:hypothetical protein
MQALRQKKSGASFQLARSGKTQLEKLRRINGDKDNGRSPARMLVFRIGSPTVSLGWIKR